MPNTVLDSSAILALFFEEASADEVEGILHKAGEADRPVLISAINWAEVLYRVGKMQGASGVQEAKRFEQTMPIEVVPVDLLLAETAAEIKLQHKLPLADAFAAALARQKKAVLITGDHDFKRVENEIKINWL